MERDTDDEHGERQQTESSDEQPAEYAYTLKREIRGEEAAQFRRLNSRRVKLRDGDHDGT